MKLSEAIRLGAMMKPQGRGTFYDQEDDGTCALGAALDACGQLNTADPGAGAQHVFIDATWPLGRRECPECHGSHYDTYAIVTHLNDCHRWTREAIADWVATIEPHDAPIVEPVPELQKVSA